MRIFPLDNTIQKYSWGGTEAIPRLLNLPNPRGEPFAELWMGAHPSAPSLALGPDGPVGLDRLIAAAPERLLGSDIAERFTSLPFLFKVLSAASPLSIQAHPSRRKAQFGYERENLAGKRLDASDRNYKDPNHKPEMTVALEPFEALCGFRPIEEIVANVRLLAGPDWRRYAGRLATRGGKVELSVFFYGLVSLPARERTELLEGAKRRVAHLAELHASGPDADTFRWTRELLEKHPNDMGALAPMILNLLRLEPGQAVFIPDGELHSYLRGSALEVMANSDNVLRGGLTSKHVDLPELVSVLGFETGVPDRLEPVPAGPGVLAYPRRAQEFRLDRLEPSLAAQAGIGRREAGPEILLCVEGELEVSEAGGEHRPLGKGDSVFVSAEAADYRLTGNGIAWRAGVPEVRAGDASPDGSRL